MGETVYAAFKSTAERAPGNAFLHEIATGKDLSYRAVLADVDALAALYARAGYGHGCRVALDLGVSAAHFRHLLALNALGAAIVPLNPDLRPAELAYLLTHSETGLVVADASAHARIAGAVPGIAIVTPDLAGLPPAQQALLPGAPGADTMAGLFYTSGTTGKPKGCILTNRYWLESGGRYRSLGGMCAVRDGRERFYNPLPLYHMNHGIMNALCAILSANCLVLTERFSPARWWPEIVSSRATIVHYLGVVPPLLLNQPVSPLERAHAVRFGLGAGVEPSLHGRFEERFGFPLIEIWGMTETGRIFAANAEPRAIDTRAFGRPDALFQAMVADAEGREVPRGTPGELLVRWGGAEGPRYGFFAGYLKDEAATAQAWRSGWFHSGDVVTQSADGMLCFVDRNKHIIRRSGENIAAAEVEAVLQAHPDVAQVAVVPVADDLREQEVCACVVLRAGAARDAELLFRHAAQNLAYYKAPGWIVFMATLPTTATQKVQKHEIFAAGTHPRDSADAVDLRALKRRQ
jgi:crotonobetaine/carnitine-CoA ligase